jgi:ribosomal-protein-alanine N-acetyltransferase
MPFVFKRMTREYAARICTWKYEPPYQLYSFDCNEDGIDELLNGDYLSGLDPKNMLIGFFCSGSSARVPGGYGAGIYEGEDRLDIGLGMEPSLTGKGLGNMFVTEGLQWMRQQFNQDKFRLVVASFNLRAIQVYRKNGFTGKATFFSTVDGKEVEFLHMEN